MRLVDLGDSLLDRKGEVKGREEKREEDERVWVGVGVEPRMSG